MSSESKVIKEKLSHLSAGNFHACHMLDTYDTGIFHVNLELEKFPQYVMFFFPSFFFLVKKDMLREDTNSQKNVGVLQSAGGNYYF